MKHDFPQNDEISVRPHRRPQPKYTYQEWLDHLYEMGMRCYWCEVPLSEVTATKDHLQPVSRFGEDVLANIVPACFQCNCKKGNKNETEFRAWCEGRPNGIYTGKGTNSDFHKDLLKSNFTGVVHDYLERYSKDEVTRLRCESEGASWAWKNPRTKSSE